MNRRTFLALLLTAACGNAQPQPLVLATTTSVEDSGLLDELIPAFEAEYPQYAMRALAVGSGQAFELGRRGDVDILITHAPAQERAFVQEGHGAQAIPIMHNRFVVIGPPEDPAGISTATSAADAFLRIAATVETFVSRGDSSGTHTRERAIWQAAGIDPTEADWYTEAGVGMGDALRYAGERDSHTLSDRATFVVVGPTTGLSILVDLPGDTLLHNPYSVTAVTNARNAQGALIFVSWITSAETQGMVGRYRAGADGAGLFLPATR
jgi:tungstate transport system substrate-binding protein